MVAPTAQPPQLPAWIGGAFTSENGFLMPRAAIFLQQLHDYLTGMNRVIPANASTSVSNVITLTLLNVQPLVQQYSSFDTYGFVADFTVTGNVTAGVVTQNGTLPIIPVFKNNGAAQATSGDITAGLQYMVTFADNLGSGAGGWVLR